MAKKVRAIVKLQLPAGKATPAPPVGPALGQHGVALMEFVKSYNERTAQQVGQIIPVAITVYEDRSFTFVTKTPPGGRSPAAGGGRRQGRGERQARDGGQGDAPAGARDRRTEVEGPQRL